MSDDDFDLVDDLFDAAALETLDKVEQRHAQSASQATVDKQKTSLPLKSSQGRVSRPPPPKRFKADEWTAIPVPNGDLADVEEEMPEVAVVIAKDGKYQTFHPVEGNPRTGSFATHTLRTASQPLRGEPGPSQRIMRSIPNKNGIRANGNGYGASQSIPYQESYAASQSRFAAITSALRQTTIAEEDNELAKLRAQIEKLKLEHEATLAALKEASEARLEREGEVETLRRNMAKSSHSYNEKINKLQQEKSEEIEKRKAAERKLNQELERARTNFALKVQELETTVRKTPWSVSRSGSGRGSIGLQAQFETPKKFGGQEVSTSAVRNRREFPQRAAPAHSKSTQPFTGFVDSFNGGSPVKPRHRTQPPAVIMEAPVRGTRPNLDHYFSPIDADSQPRAPGHAKSESRDEAASLVFESFPDVDGYGESPRINIEIGTSMGEVRDEDKIEEELLQGGELINLPDVREQCYAILFSHTSLPDYQLTLQRLFSLDLSNLQEERDTYVHSCSSLMEAVASREPDFLPVASRIATSLIRMAGVLSRASSLVNLAAVLELIGTMCLWIDGLTSLLLDCEELCPAILSALVDIVKSHGLPPSGGNADAWEVAMRQGLLLMELLCLTSPQDDINQLEHLVRAPNMMSTLLNEKQPTWVLCASMRIFCIISTYSECAAMLLSYPHNPGTRNPTGDLTRIPHIERISHLLVDSVTLSSAEHHELQASIITSLTQLTLASPEAMATVTHSQSVIPSLVATLDAYATLLWDEHPIESLEASKHTKKNLDLVVGILQLLHYIVFKMGAQLDLQRVIQFPPHRFNGLEHMFVVGLGRLSYADPPEWNDNTCKLLCETCTELARDLLEQFINGPEVDTIWASYQDAGASQDYRSQGQDGLLDMPTDDGDMNIVL